jgi:hypothetical protein
MTASVCPKCNSAEGLRTISYGMPEKELDESKFAYGGCCLDELNATTKCVVCDWEGDFVTVAKLMSMD